MEYTYDCQLANDDGPFAAASVRFIDKGKGRAPMWRGSCQLQDIALSPGGCYAVILPDERSFEIVVDECIPLGTDKCIVSFSVAGDLDA